MQEKERKIISLPKEKITNFLVSALLFFACPGDDIAASLAYSLPSIATPPVGVETLLGAWWTNKRDEKAHQIRIKILME